MAKRLKINHRLHIKINNKNGLGSAQLRAQRRQSSLRMVDIAKEVLIRFNCTNECWTIGHIDAQFYQVTAIQLAENEQIDLFEFEFFAVLFHSDFHQNGGYAHGSIQNAHDERWLWARIKIIVELGHWRWWTYADFDRRTGIADDFRCFRWGCGQRWYRPMQHSSDWCTVIGINYSVEKENKWVKWELTSEVIAANAYFFVALAPRMVNVLFISVFLPIDCCGVKQLLRFALLTNKLHIDVFFGVSDPSRKSRDDSKMLDFSIGVSTGLSA